MRKIFLACSGVLAILSSCGNSKIQQSGNILTDTTWELSTLNGQDASPAAFSKVMPYVNFGTDNKITGNGGCNGFSGSYNVSAEGDINISRVMATKMYCEGVNENEFMQTLNKVNVTKIEGDKLTLLEGVNVVMILKPKGKSDTN